MSQEYRVPSVLLKPVRLPECGPHLTAAEICEHWFWDGDFGHVLGSVQGEEERWLVEKGVMKQEDGWHDGAKDLLVGDVVYRIRTAAALEMGGDPREAFFDWFYVNVLTGAEQPRSAWYAVGGNLREHEFVTAAQVTVAYQLFRRGKQRLHAPEYEPDCEPGDEP